MCAIVVQDYGNRNYVCRGQNFSKGYGHPMYAETSARRESVIQPTVQGNLSWMASRFVGFKLRQKYEGLWYEGVVCQVGWHRPRGYGGTVLYEDGYVEIMPMAKLVELQRRKEENNKNAQVWHELNQKYCGVIETIWCQKRKIDSNHL